MTTLDPNTEAYYAAFQRAQQTAEKALQKEVKKIVDEVEAARAFANRITPVLRSDGSMSFPGLHGDRAFAWLTDLILEIENVMARLLSKRTSEIWMLQSKRQLACRMMDKEAWESGSLSFAEELQAKLACAIGQFACPGNS